VSEIDPVVLLLAFAAALAAGLVNSMAGGGTLLTFPTLLAVGLESKVANATSTLGLLWGSLGGAMGYRQEIRRHGRDALLFFLPCLVGGLVGGLLLLWTKEHTFRWLAPWLILAATMLFMLQGVVTRYAGQSKAMPQAASGRRWLLVIPLQFLVAVYGGYFGAGIGILMLATLGLLGIDDLHQRNGLKNLGALCINSVAIPVFIVNGLIDWPVALVMAVGALTGGYLSAGIARRIGTKYVRYVVIAVGLLATVWTAWEQFRGV
jgi:hypothetical protein